MHLARKLFCWQFAVVSLVCFEIAISNFLDAIRTNRHAHFVACVVVLGLFAPLAVLFGWTWWNVWREKRPARLLAITSSLITILLAFLPVVLFHQGPYLVLVAMGVAGLIVFWSKSAVIVRNPGSGI